MKADRIGLVIILASLASVAAIIWLVFGYQQEHRVSNIRSQGVSLVRALSGVPYEQLVPGGEQQGIMQVLRHSARDNDFAYLSVDDAHRLHAHAMEQGAEILKPVTDEPWGMREFALRTPDGHRIMIGQRLGDSQHSG